MRRQLVFYLKNYPGISAIVSSKVYPQRAPQGTTLPYITVTVSGRDASYDQDGADGYNHQFYDIKSNASTLKQAADLSYQVEQAMKIQQTFIGDTGDQEQLASTDLIGEFDDFDLFDDSQQGQRVVMLTYNVSYQEA